MPNFVFLRKFRLKILCKIQINFHYHSIWIRVIQISPVIEIEDNE